MRTVAPLNAYFDLHFYEIIQNLVASVNGDERSMKVPVKTEKFNCCNLGHSSSTR